jgi:hypothetical protein
LHQGVCAGVGTHYDKIGRCSVVKSNTPNELLTEVESTDAMVLSGIGR